MCVMVNCFISRHAHMHECVDGKMLWFYQDTVSDIHAVDIFNRLAAKCSLHCRFPQVHKFTHIIIHWNLRLKGTF